MRVGIVGAGLQGRRRAPAVRQTHNDVVVVASEHGISAKALAQTVGCEAVAGWEPVVARDDLDAVLICTPTHLHAPIAIACLKKGIHVLCEKPLARTVEEAQAMIAAAAQQSGAVLKCGFNHRHHPGIQQARKWFDLGAIGEPVFVRCRYGICGRPGYEKEWRASPELSGGGHLMEQGIHGIDLARWFLGDFSQATGFVANGYWDMPVEDNAFALFRTARGQIASIHASLTQWKNLFSFEVYGKDGYVTVEGLGGGYGTERAILGRRDFYKPFAEEVIEYRGEDRSWHDEWQEFVSAIQEKREPLGNGRDGLEALRLVHAIYEAAHKGCVVSL